MRNHSTYAILEIMGRPKTKPLCVCGCGKNAAYGTEHGYPDPMFATKECAYRLACQSMVDTRWCHTCREWFGRDEGKYHKHDE